MWVWRKLGFDHVFELPRSSLETIGRRCRAADTLPNKELSYQSDAIFDGEGALLEICDAKQSSHQFSSTSTELKGPSQPWQLVAVGDKPGSKTICMPGSMDLVLEPDPECPKMSLIDTSAATMKDALEMLVARAKQEGECTFTWRLPKALARLSEMAQAECCDNTPGPDKWPLTVVGAVVGAELLFTVSVDDRSVVSALSYGDGSLENHLASQAALVQEHYVQCDGFRLHIVQRGGPPLDPSRWHGLDEADVALEAERWSKQIIKRPSTWRMLYVKTHESQTAPGITEARSNIIEQPVHGRKSNDVVLAATGMAEMYLEPFELNYGDQHIKAIRRMLEEEVASILNIKSSQVLCGDLYRKGQGDRQKHVRRDRIGLRFALLHEELANSRDEAAKVPFGNLRKGRSSNANRDSGKRMSALPPIGVSDTQTVLTRMQVKTIGEAQNSVSNTTKNSMTTALKMTMEAAAMAAEIEVIEKSVQQARMGKKVKQSLTQSEDSMLALKSTEIDQTKVIRRASTAPDLLALTALPNSPAKTQMQLQSLTTAGIETRQELQPDNLLKELLKALSDSKHPLHRHLDVFPVLARIVKGSPTLNSTLVTHPDTMKLGSIADSFKSAINRKPAAATQKRRFEKDADDVNINANPHLNQMRAHVLEVEARPDGELAQKREQLGKKSPKELMDMMEASYNLYNDLTLVLDVFLEQTEDSEDRSVKLRSQQLIPKCSHVMAIFKSDRHIVERVVKIYSNTTRHDPGSVDSIYEEDIAPVILDSLKCFPKARGLQLHGCRVLRRLYDLARRKSIQGRRTILLGRRLQEVWTYQGIDHVLMAMEYFREDGEIQLETFNMLVPLTETISAHGKTIDIFKAVERAMSIHSSHPDLLAHGIHTIARLGPVFMSHEHTGIRAIVEAMARHRSCVKLQRVGNKALFALCGQQDSLARSRKDGAVSAIVNAMNAHNKDQQVLQMGVRCLEKHCPRGLWKLSHICGDLVSVLPIVLWRNDPVDQNPPVFNLANLRNTFPDFDDTTLLDNFHADIVDSGRPPSPPSGETNKGSTSISDKDNLATLTGYRRVGLRDDLDASDRLWAVPGPAAIYPPVKGQHNVLNKAVANLKKLGCDIESQLVAGPRKNHIKQLVEALQEGLGIPPKVVPVAKRGSLSSTVSTQSIATQPPPAKTTMTSKTPTKPVIFGCEDAELFSVILGHFAWHSRDNATEVVAAGGVGVILKWLRNKEMTQSLDATDAQIVYPMQRACLAALSCICRHGSECAGALLAEGAHQDLLEFIGHHDLGMRRSAMRCLARLLPYSVKRSTNSEKLQPHKVWPVILTQLTQDDEAIRTAAAATALEAVVADWAKLEKFEEQNTGEQQLDAFIEALVSALQRAVQSSAAAAALPVLLTIASLAEDDNALNLLGGQTGLMPLLTTWPPRSVEAMATGIDRSTAAAAAKALESLCERGVVELSVRDLQMLLTCASSDHTVQSPALRDALEAALTVAVARVEDAGFLAQLLGTQIKAVNGRNKLANIEGLEVVAQRLAELLEKVPGKNAGAFNEVLTAALDHVEPLFNNDFKGEEHATLRHLLSELRGHCSGSSFGQGYPADGTYNSLPELPSQTSVSDITTKLPTGNSRSKIDTMA